MAVMKTWRVASCRHRHHGVACLCLFYARTIVVYDGISSMALAAWRNSDDNGMKKYQRRRKRYRRRKYRK